MLARTLLGCFIKQGKPPTLEELLNVQKQLLSPHQKTVLGIVRREGHTTASEVAIVMGIPSQQANNILKSMVEDGVLRRSLFTNDESQLCYRYEEVL